MKLEVFEKVNNDVIQYEQFDDLEEALQDGTLWGCDLLPLSRQLIELILSGKIIKTDNGEYVQIIYLSENTGG